jgi:hypothetical protein
LGRGLGCWRVVGGLLEKGWDRKSRGASKGRIGRYLRWVYLGQLKRAAGGNKVKSTEGRW